MKTFYCSALLITLLAAPAYADTPGNPVPDPNEHSLSLVVDLGREGVDNATANAEDEQMADKAIAKLDTIIDATGARMSEEEKSEAKQDIRDAVHDLGKISGAAGQSGYDDGGTSFGDALIAITAITLIFGSPLLIVAAVLYSTYRKKRLIHETINQYVSSGKDVPAEVMNSLHAEITPRNSLHKGLVMSGVGLGIIACFAVMGEIEAAALGLIPLFIGLAQILVWKLEDK